MMSIKKQNNTLKPNNSGFVLVVTLFILISVTTAVMAIVQSSIQINKRLAQQHKQLIEQMSLRALQQQSFQFANHDNVLAELASLSFSGSYLSETPNFDFTQLVSCGESASGTWQVVSNNEPLKMSNQAFETYIYYALMSPIQLAESNSDSFYITIFKQCVWSYQQQHWLTRWQVYKIHQNQLVEEVASSSLQYE